MSTPFVQINRRRTKRSCRRSSICSSVTPITPKRRKHPKFVKRALFSQPRWRVEFERSSPHMPVNNVDDDGWNSFCSPNRDHVIRRSAKYCSFKSTSKLSLQNLLDDDVPITWSIEMATPPDHKDITPGLDLRSARRLNMGNSCVMDESVFGANTSLLIFSELLEDSCDHSRQLSDYTPSLAGNGSSFLSPPPTDGCCGYNLVEKDADVADGCLQSTPLLRKIGSRAVT